MKLFGSCLSLLRKVALRMVALGMVALGMVALGMVSLGMVLLGMVALVGCGAAAPPLSASSPMLGERLPKVKRRTVAGAVVDLRQPPGHVVVVKFFAKYCKPCAKTLPVAERVHRAHPEVTFIGVAEDEYREDVDWLIATYRLSFGVVHDRGNVLAGRLRVTEMPITFVADRAAMIRWVGGPNQAEGDLAAAIDWVGREDRPPARP